MNDRALRDIIVGLGGPGNGFPREDGFDITVASEVMAIFCLATSLADLKERLGNIIVGYTRDAEAGARARPEGARRDDGAAERRAKPNLVQTLENNPAFMHGGPFANIAHGCNWVMATKAAPEAGRLRGDRGRLRRRPGRREVHRHQVPQGGPPARRGGDRGDGARAEAPRRRRRQGAEHREPGGAGEGRREPASATSRTSASASACRAWCRSTTSPPTPRPNSRCCSSAWREHGRAGRCVATPLGRGRRGRRGPGARGGALVRTAAEQRMRFVYDDAARCGRRSAPSPTKIYGATDVSADEKVRDAVPAAAGRRLRALPGLHRQDAVLASPPTRRCAARRAGHVVDIREVRLAAGAEFIVVVCGDIMTMPGLPKVPSAEVIDLDEQGRVVGLF